MLGLYMVYLIIFNNIGHFITIDLTIKLDTIFRPMYIVFGDWGATSPFQTKEKKNNPNEICLTSHPQLELKLGGQTLVIFQIYIF